VNLAELVRFWGHWCPDHEALICDGIRHSWAGLDAVAAGLAARGAGKGDRISPLMLNRPEQAHIVLGTPKLGAVSVPLAFRLTAGELASLVLDADCTVVVTEEASAPALEIAPAAGRLDFVCSAGSDLPSYHRLFSAEGTPPAVDIADDDPRFTVTTDGPPARTFSEKLAKPELRKAPANPAEAITVRVSSSAVSA
jgi:acyl-CoA synthetase (AMP-forming)/AMP-acid ligase II